MRTTKIKKCCMKLSELKMNEMYGNQNGQFFYILNLDILTH